MLLRWFSHRLLNVSSLTSWETAIKTAGKEVVEQSTYALNALQK